MAPGTNHFLTFLLDGQLLVLSFRRTLGNQKETSVPVSLFIAATNGLFFVAALIDNRAHSWFFRGLFRLSTLSLVQHSQLAIVPFRFAPRDAKETE